MSKTTVLACAGLNPESAGVLCERHDECAHYEEWWSCVGERKWSMNLCTQAGGEFKMFTAWRKLIREGVKVEFAMRTAQGELFA